MPPIHMQELAPNSEHSSLSGTAVKQSSEGSRNLVCTLATIRQGAPRQAWVRDPARPPCSVVTRGGSAGPRL